MARPRLDVGEHGKITVAEVAPRQYVARCRFRGTDGKMRHAEASGTSKAAAERALKRRVRQRVGDRDSEIGGDTLLRKVAERWWEIVERRVKDGELNVDTRREYLRYKDQVVELCGDLALRECSVGRLETMVMNAAGDKKRTRSELKRTLVAIFDLAVRLGAIPANIARDMDVGRAPSDATRALTPEELTTMRSRIHTYETTGGHKAPRAEGKTGKGGRPRAVYLMDVFDLQLAIGCRIGELLALQWDTDVHGLHDDQTTVTITATLKHRSRADAERLGLPAGLYRQEKPKTDAGMRRVVLPAFAVAILRRLHAERQPGVPWVIATSVGTPRSPSNVRTALRKARGDDFDWVTPHTLRRTTGTIIAATTGNSLATARVLGHASTAITEAAYLDWSHLNTDVSEVVQSLAPKVRYLNESAG